MAQPTRRLTPNQLVAYNLKQARVEEGLTQEQAADRLEPLLGVRWTGPTFSVAERWDPSPGQKVRRFDPEEIVAFAIAFNTTVSFFFVPPVDTADKGIELPGGTVPIDDYLELVDDRAPAELLGDMEEPLDRVLALVEDLEVRVKDLSSPSAGGRRQRPTREG